MYDKLFSKLKRSITRAIRVADSDNIILLSPSYFLTIMFLVRLDHAEMALPIHWKEFGWNLSQSVIQHIENISQKEAGHLYPC